MDLLLNMADISEDTSRLYSFIKNKTATFTLLESLFKTIKAPEVSIPAGDNLAGRTGYLYIQ